MTTPAAATTLLLNGKPTPVQAEPDTPLLWVLRGELQLTGTKFGCGMALCGACTVHVDGEPVRGCVTPLAAVATRHGTYLCFAESPGMNRSQMLQAILAAMPGLNQATLDGMTDDALADLAKNLTPAQPVTAAVRGARMRLKRPGEWGGQMTT